MNYFVYGCSFGIMFTVAVVFMFKEETVIYKHGYIQCVIDKESK
jgi:hypothetical protein